MQHHDLRAELGYLESFTNYHELRIEYSSLLEATEVRPRKTEKKVQGVANYH